MKIMVDLHGKRISGAEAADPSWNDLYKIGGIFCFLFVATIVIAVVAFFIWPYTPGVSTVESIFTSLQADRIGALISLDLLLLAGTLSLIPIELALYIVLRRVNQSYALLALVLALMAIIISVQGRPVVEIAYLGDQYAMATTDLARSQYLAAGQALLPYFNGTAWMVFTVLLNISGLLYSLLMLRSGIFGKWTAIIGAAIAILSFAIFVPDVGPILSLLATIGSVVWLLSIGLRLLRLGWQKPATTG